MPLLEAALALVPMCPRSERYRWRVQSEISAHLPADEALPLLERIVQEAQARQTWSHAGPAWVRLIEALLRDGRHDAAALQANALSSELERLPPMGLYAGEYHWALCRRGRRHHRARPPCSTRRGLDQRHRSPPRARSIPRFVPESQPVQPAVARHGGPPRRASDLIRSARSRDPKQRARTGRSRAPTD